MNNLLSLAVLIKFAEIHLGEVFSLGCYFRTTKFIPEEKLRFQVDEWLVSLSASEVYHSEAPLLTDACTNIVNMLLEEGHVIPAVDLDDTIIHSDQTESLILRFQELILDNTSLLFSFKYWPISSVKNDPSWKASIIKGTHWDSTNIATVYGDSLFKVCSQLMKQYEKVKHG